MVEFTFFEVHLNDPQLTANAPFSSRSKDVSASDEPLEEDEGTGKGSAIAALVGLVFLVTVAFLAKRKFTGGDDVEGEETVSVGGVEV